MASNKNLREDQVGMEIVLDEGTFIKDKDKLVDSIKKDVPVTVKPELDEAAARKVADKADQIAAEGERKKAEREAEALRQREADEIESLRRREQEEAESARRKAQQEAEDAAKREERLRKFNEMDKAFIDRQKADLKKLAAQADSLIPAGAIGDGIREELGAKIEALSSTLKAKVSVEAFDVDSFRAEVSALINEVESDVVDLRVQADTDRAYAEMAALLRDRELDIEVDVDTARATAQMAAFRASQIAANAAAGLGGGAGGGGFDASQLFGMFGGGGSGGGLTSTIGMAGPYGAAAAAALGLAQAAGQVVAQTAGLAAVGGAVGFIGTAASASALQVTSLATDAVSLAGVAALLPAVAVGVGGIVGASATILNEIPEALKALREAEDAVVEVNPEVEALRAKRARETVVDAEKAAAKAQIAAIDSVAAARKAADDANVNAIESYAAASRRLDDVQKEQIRASLALAEVREREQASLERLAITVERTAFNSDKAKDAVKKAEDNLLEASTNKRLMPEQLKAYQKALEDAEITAKEAANKHKETQREFEKADHAQVEGTDSVIAAKERLAEADENARLASEAARKASEAMAEIRIEGEERVAKVQAESAERVTEAQERAARAKEDLHIRGLEQADKEAAAVKKVEDALKKISPAAREAVEGIFEMMDRYKQAVTLPAQEAFFVGFADSLRQATDALLPELESGVVRIAGTLGDSADLWMQEISGSLDEGVLDGILDNLNTGIENANAGISPLVDAFTRMTETGSEFFPRIGEGFAELSERFGEFIRKADETGELDKWIEEGLDGIEDIGTIALNVAKAIDEIHNAAQAAGGLSLDSFAGGMEQFAAWLAEPGTQETMRTLFEGGVLFFDKLGESLPAIGQMISDNAPAFKEMAGIFGEIGSEVFTGLAELFSDPAVVDGAKEFATGLKEGVEAIQPHIPQLAEFLGAFLEFLGAFSAEGGKGLATFIDQVGPGATDLFEGLARVMPELGKLLQFALDLTAITPEEAGAFLAGLVSGVQGALDFFSGDFDTDWNKVWDNLFGPLVPPDVLEDWKQWAEDLLGGVDTAFAEFDFYKLLGEAFSVGGFFDEVGQDFEDGFGDVIDNIVEAFRDGGIDALDAMKTGMSLGNLTGNLFESLNPLQVFNWGGGGDAGAQSFSGETMMLAANAPTSSDLSSYGGSRASTGPVLGAQKHYTIEHLEMHAENDLNEMYEGFFNIIDSGR